MKICSCLLVCMYVCVCASVAETMNNHVNMMLTLIFFSTESAQSLMAFSKEISRNLVQPQTNILTCK